MYACPVCGFAELSDPPENFNICPCCGTEFDLDDAFTTHAELRLKWIRNGARWWSQVESPPENWNPQVQLNLLRSSA